MRQLTDRDTSPSRGIPAVASRSGNLIRLSRQGLSPISQVARRLGHGGPPRFAGVTLSAPDEVSSWGIAYEVAGGEYSFPGFEPRPGDRVIDVGANIGIYALWAARRGAKVIAYEPMPATFAHLSSNTRKHTVEPVQAAVVGTAETGGKVRLYLHEERSTRHSLLGREVETGEQLERHVDVSAVTIDEVLADDCDLLKVDCEGAEFEIFQQVEDSSLRRTARIVLEFHRAIGNPALLLDRLGGSGFLAEVVTGTDPTQQAGVIVARRRDSRQSRS